VSNLGLLAVAPDRFQPHAGSATPSTRRVMSEAEPTHPEYVDGPARVLPGHPTTSCRIAAASGGRPAHTARCSPTCGQRVCDATPARRRVTASTCAQHRRGSSPRQRSQPQPVDARVANSTTWRRSTAFSWRNTNNSTSLEPCRRGSPTTRAKQPPNQHVDDRNNTRRSSQDPVRASETAQVSGAI